MQTIGRDCCCSNTATKGVGYNPMVPLRLAPLRSAPLRSASIRSAPRKFLSPLAYAANNSCAVMLFHCPRITLRLAVLRPTFFPKRRGVRVMPLLVFDCAQRLHGCCSALALRAGHGPRNRACKPLGGFNYGSNTPTDEG
jgi:hypothetical protein